LLPVLVQLRLFLQVDCFFSFLSRDWEKALMEAPISPTALAKQVADRVLSAIYGPDLVGCQVAPDAIAAIVQEALTAQTNREQTINGVLIEVLEKIQVIATPPDRDQVKDLQHLASILRERADGIYVIATETLNAWRKLNAGS
jgi:hypothetical protein